MAQLSDEQVEKNQSVVEQLIETFPEPRKKLVKEMFEVVGTEYFTAPASPKEDFHNCFPGGLCDHSLRVTKNLRQIATSFGRKDFDVPTLNFVGLFHDLGKVGDSVEPYYKVLEGQANQWRRQRGEFYEINKKCVFMPTQERGLYLLQKFGIVLTPDEYLAIRLNDGMYDETNKRYAMREPDLAVLTHMADRWATTQEKRSE